MQTKAVKCLKFLLWYIYIGKNRSHRRGGFCDETDSSTPFPVLPEGFSRVRFVALSLESGNENLQIRSLEFVLEPDPGFSPRLDL